MLMDNGFEHENGLVRFERQLAILHRCYNLHIDVVDGIRLMAEALDRDAFDEGKSVGDYLEGWEEVFKAGKLDES